MINSERYRELAYKVAKLLTQVRLMNIEWNNSDASYWALLNAEDELKHAQSQLHAYEQMMKHPGACS